MLDVSLVYQLLIIIILVGLSSGAVTSLSFDHRLALAYLSIIILPLMGTVLVIESDISYVLFFILLLYYITHIVLILKTYQHEIEFHMLQSEQELLHHLFKEAPLGIFIYNHDLIITDCNEHFLNLFDNDRESIIGLNLNTIPDISPLSKLRNALREGSQIYRGEYTSIKGKHFWVEAKIFPYKDKSNNTIGSFVLIDDKTKERAAQEQLEYMAEHDVLTGLYNRRGFRKFMEKLVMSEEHKTEHSLLFYLDLNQFKGINDSMGHTIGDAVLLNVSQRLTYGLGKECNISRLGGDEFVIIIPYISHNSKIAKLEAQEYVKTIEAIFDTPFIIEDLHLHIKASIGIIIIEPKYQNIEEIIRHADITMVSNQQIG